MRRLKKGEVLVVDEMVPLRIRIKPDKKRGGFMLELQVRIIKSHIVRDQK
jgi:hypothetical protein